MINRILVSVGKIGDDRYHVPNIGQIAYNKHELCRLRGRLVRDSL